MKRSRPSKISQLTKSSVRFPTLDSSLVFFSSSSASLPASVCCFPTTSHGPTTIKRLLSSSRANPKWYSFTSHIAEKRLRYLRSTEASSHQFSLPGYQRTTPLPPSLESSHRDLPDSDLWFLEFSPENSNPSNSGCAWTTHFTGLFLNFFVKFNGISVFSLFSGIQVNSGISGDILNF